MGPLPGTSQTLLRRIAAGKAGSDSRVILPAAREDRGSLGRAIPACQFARQPRRVFSHLRAPERLTDARDETPHAGAMFEERPWAKAACGDAR